MHMKVTLMVDNTAHINLVASVLGLLLNGTSQTHSESQYYTGRSSAVI